MVFQSVIKSIPSLIYSIIFLGLFYWQFIELYSFIIEQLSRQKLLILYGYIFIYLFGVQIIAVMAVNLLNKYLIKKTTFAVVTIITIVIFYILLFDDFYHVIDYFIKYPLPYNSIIGIVSFIILSFGYSLYSIVVLLFGKSIPLTHTSIFIILGIIYSIWFILLYCQIGK